MSLSASEVATLLKKERFNPDIIPQLESYLVSQVQQDNADAPSAAYDPDANRALIKLYQFFPQKANTQNILLAETLALVYGASSKEGSLDFGSLGCLINESHKKDEPYPTLIQCAELQDSCQFTEFWTVYHSIATNSGDYELVSKLTKSAHAKNALRKSILNTLSLAFKTTKLSYVLEQLDMKTDEVDAVLGKVNTVVEKVNTDSDSICFCDNVENTKRDKVNQEGGIDFAMIRGLVVHNKTRVDAE